MKIRKYFNSFQSASGKQLKRFSGPPSDWLIWIILNWQESKSSQGNGDNFIISQSLMFRFWGLIMFGSFSLINIIVLLNLLIAMMNHSYQLISVSSVSVTNFILNTKTPPPFYQKFQNTNILSLKKKPYIFLKKYIMKHIAQSLWYFERNVHLQYIDIFLKILCQEVVVCSCGIYVQHCVRRYLSFHEGTNNPGGGKIWFLLHKCQCWAKAVVARQIQLVK